MANTSTFFWYDLETTSINPREGRIMQFAGQQTDMGLTPVGEPVNVLIRLTDDILPEPDAILITGITPQATLAEGISEAEFLKLFYEQISVPGTIFAGYNSVRFDDEFMRYMNYRNFYDAYQWQWKDGRSRWDLLDVVRMTRALRPDGIEWPFGPDGKPSNRLELLTSLNKLDHKSAHDALSDVYATIAVAKLIHDKQPKLFDWLLSVRGKKEVAGVVDTGQPFVYTSGRYSGEFEKTTVAVKLAGSVGRPGALVYDLRHDPSEFIDMNPAQLAERMAWTKDETAPKRLPVKLLRYNTCPAVAPLGVLDAESQKRLQLDLKEIESNRAKLHGATDFMDNLQKAFELKDKKYQTSAIVDPQTVDSLLYDGFFDSFDSNLMADVAGTKPADLGDLGDKFRDDRLKQLLPLYKARNFSKSLTSEERAAWEDFRAHRLLDGGQASRAVKYMSRLVELKATNKDDQKGYLLEELQLYAESIMPTEIDLN
ncbi:MAG: exodeoxyribonuclease I [Candidatus Saccharimonadales bacterium]